MPTFEQICSRRMKVLADENRLAVVRALMDGPKCVADINKSVAIEQSLLSHHLKVLRSAQLVISHREGKSIFYQLHPTALRSAPTRGIDLGCCTLSF